MEQDYIEQKINELAEENNVRPIVAREVGYRMMGVAHKDSDHDVMVLFSEPPEEYIELGGNTGTIEKKYDDGELDLDMWNVRKFANLCSDSNPNAVEFLMAETQYFNYSEFEFETLAGDVRTYFNHMALYHHYLSLANKNYQRYVDSGTECTKGRQFYILRATAMATHIRKEGTFPKMNVYDFLDQTEALDEDVASLLRRLADAKAVGQGDHECGDLVEDMFSKEYDTFMEPEDHRTNDPTDALLNELIRKTILK